MHMKSASEQNFLGVGSNFSFFRCIFPGAKKIQGFQGLPGFVDHPDNASYRSSRGRYSTTIFAKSWIKLTSILLKNERFQDGNSIKNQLSLSISADNYTLLPLIKFCKKTKYLL